MTLVVDASVALKWFKAEPDSPQALALIAPGALVAPTLVLAEVANACWKALRSRTMSATQAAEAVEELPGFFATLFDIASLVDRALAIAIALDHPVYDCFYLALAEREAATLVTADRRLISRVTGTPWATTVRDLSTWTTT